MTDKINFHPIHLDKTTVEALDKMLYEVWLHNNKYMLEVGGRPLAGKDDNDIDGDGNRTEYLTVSETIGYKLFREVLMGIHAIKRRDKRLVNLAAQKFGAVFRWANLNLRRDHIEAVYAIDEKRWISVPEKKRDSLLAWRWTPTIDGSRGGIIRSPKFRDSDHVWIDGMDGAPDGDLFTIAALYMASMIWTDMPSSMDYRQAATEMARDVRKKYLQKIGDKWHLLAGDEFFHVNGINPSYGFEAIYDILADLDPPGKDVWREVKCTSMQAAVVGADSTLHKLDGTRVQGKVGVPPNWLTFDGTSYKDMPWFDNKDWFMGWDGIRTLWLKAAYYLYNQNEYARRYLTDHTGTVGDYGPFAFLKREYNRRGLLQLGYGIDGTKSDRTMLEDGTTFESPCSYGIYLGYFYAAGDEDMTMAMINKLKNAYRAGTIGEEIGPLEGTFSNGAQVEPDNYFSDYWAWFGIAMALGLTQDFFDIYKARRTGKNLPEFEKELRCGF